MHRISKLTHHVVPEGVVYARIADGDYEKSKHKLQGVSIFGSSSSAPALAPLAAGLPERLLTLLLRSSSPSLAPPPAIPSPPPPARSPLGAWR